jgi:2',3'-cyclic-nucleotide 2'-phosphodiesterase
MPDLRERYAPDLCVINGENSAGGLGITEKTANDLFGMGFDVITLGNHTYRRREAYDYLDRADRVIRPANFMAGSPGSGHVVVEAGGVRVCVINLIGMLHLQAARSPFAEVDMLLDRLASDADAFVVDFHAEVTSEKVAMGWHLDGRAGAVLGTHTHVPTADGRVLPGETAFICDVGMTGSRSSVLGVRWEQALEGFRTQMPQRFDTADEDVWINAVLVELRDDGLADTIEQVIVPASPGAPG